MRNEATTGIIAIATIARVETIDDEDIMMNINLYFRKYTSFSTTELFFFGELVLSLKKKELTMMRVTVFEMTKRLI